MSMATDPILLAFRLCPMHDRQISGWILFLIGFPSTLLKLHPGVPVKFQLDFRCLLSHSFPVNRFAKSGCGIAPSTIVFGSIYWSSCCGENENFGTTNMSTATYCKLVNVGAHAYTVPPFNLLSGLLDLSFVRPGNLFMRTDMNPSPINTTFWY